MTASHLSDQRLRFLGQFNALSATIAGAGFAAKLAPYLQLIQRAYQRWLLNAYRLAILNLRLVRRQLMNIVQRDPMCLRQFQSLRRWSIRARQMRTNRARSEPSGDSNFISL
ncbi:Uncharacterised protein [Salmonella enterica subsp. enterica]|uniref:Uncharacterized protein n=1 Tax=Salmonella enterica I TaxID=59201 RepID=A0A379WWA3_SALET|nr:Uncharacterised protein [Salmonella enterica subsp. enterica]